MWKTATEEYRQEQPSIKVKTADAGTKEADALSGRPPRHYPYVPKGHLPRA